MKEGSFDSPMSGLDFVAEGTTDVRHIPTPDRIPDRTLPKSAADVVAKSGVIESLISQNDDLMARLNVSLRRIATLEDQVQQAETVAAQFKARFENLNDQVLVLKEQSRIVAERARAAEGRNQQEAEAVAELKEQITLLEVRYAELYSSSAERQARLQKDVETETQKLNRYTKYRQNMHAAIQRQRGEAQKLRAKIQFQDQQVQDLRKNLAEATDYISTQNRQFHQDRQSLTEAYEKEIRTLQTEIIKLKDQNQTLELRSRDYDQLYTEKIRVENELVITRRREQEVEVRASAEVADIQKALARHRNDAKDLALRLEKSEADHAADKITIANLSEERKALTEQVENLQILWRDQQINLEKLTEQKSALQKLNQELSQSLNQYRRDMRELKDNMERLTQEARKSGHEVGEKPSDVVTPAILEKIDKALADIHR